MGDLVFFVIVVLVREGIGSVSGGKKVLYIVEMMNLTRKLLTAFVKVLSCGLVLWLWVPGN